MLRTHVNSVRCIKQLSYSAWAHHKYSLRSWGWIMWAIVLNALSLLERKLCSSCCWKAPPNQLLCFPIGHGWEFSSFRHTSYYFTSIHIQGVQGSREEWNHDQIAWDYTTAKVAHSYAKPNVRWNTISSYFCAIKITHNRCLFEVLLINNISLVWLVGILFVNQKLVEA